MFKDSYQRVVALNYGIEGAVMIENMCFWLKENIKENNCNYVCKTINDITKLSGSWTYKQVRRILDFLVDEDVLTRGMCKNTRTYTIIDKNILELYDIDLIKNNDDDDYPNNCKKLDTEPSAQIGNQNTNCPFGQCHSECSNNAKLPKWATNNIYNNNNNNNNIYNHDSYIMKNKIPKKAFFKKHVLEKSDNDFIDKIVKSFKEKYNAVLIKDCVKSLFRKKGAKVKELLQHYVDNFHLHLESVRYVINDIGRFFYSTVLKEFPTPKKYVPQAQNTYVQKPVQSTNYEQRKYDDEFFKGLYENV